MSSRRLPLLLVILFASILSTPVFAQNGHGGPTRLLRTPTVSSTLIGFAYANNIWVVPRAGGSARRLTSFQGQTGNPHFSPDGRWIAFSGEYAGNFDVYIVPSEGGEPKRLTWHPGTDMVEGWSSDGRSILFLQLAHPGRRAARRGSGQCRSRVVSNNRCFCRALTRERFLPTAHASLTG